MAITKVIYQTYSSWNQLPWVAKFFIWRMRKINKDYSYEFYDDNAVEAFIKKEFEPTVFQQYNKLKIGASKADFFRYAILFKRGGVYLDVDSRILGKLDWIKPEDEAIISKENNPGPFYIQWALIYAKGHPILKKTLEKVVKNIETQKYPNDVHKTTGPEVYTEAINEYIANDKNKNYRFGGRDYNGKMKFKFWLSGFWFRNKRHWRVIQDSEESIFS